MVLSTGEAIAASAADPDPLKGFACPVWAHIRKVNPRDLGTNMGGPAETAGFQMLRRGIPFGPPYLHDHRDDPQNGIERGLMFIAYQTSIRGQFQVLNSDWMNSTGGPAAFGHDLLVGQAVQHGVHGPKEADFNQVGAPVPVRLHTMSQWVIPTGGTYLFSPSLSAIQTLVAR